MLFLPYRGGGESFLENETSPSHFVALPHFQLKRVGVDLKSSFISLFFLKQREEIGRKKQGLKEIRCVSVGGWGGRTGRFNCLHYVSPLLSLPNMPITCHSPNDLLFLDK